MVSPIRSDPTRRAVLLGGAALLSTPAVRAASARPVVFAAASLKPVLDEIARGRDIALTYGGSGTIARQVAQGAPADVVLLAATDWMDWLTGQGVLHGAPVTVARNTLVLAGAPGVGTVDLTAAGVAAALGTGRMAMGDPMLVPAGRYGQQALGTLGLWDRLSDRLILTGDVRAALAYVARGDVPLGLVYASDAVGTGVDVAARVPAGTHAPILYPGATVTDRPEAAALLTQIAASSEVFARHGFAP